MEAFQYVQVILTSFFFQSKSNPDYEVISTRMIQNYLAKREFLSMLNDFRKKSFPCLARWHTWGHVPIHSSVFFFSFFLLSSSFSPTGQWPCWAFKQHKKKHTNIRMKEGRRVICPETRTVAPCVQPSLGLSLLAPAPVTRLCLESVYRDGGCFVNHLLPRSLSPYPATVCALVYCCCCCCVFKRTDGFPLFLFFSFLFFTRKEIFKKW